VGNFDELTGLIISIPYPKFNIIKMIFDRKIHHAKKLMLLTGGKKPWSSIKRRTISSKDTNIQYIQGLNLSEKIIDLKSGVYLIKIQTHIQGFNLSEKTVDQKMG